MNDVGCEKVFLTPEEPIDIAQIDLGLQVGAKQEGRTPASFRPILKLIRN